ncbi:hypothetical protein GQ43DRAFT_16912 [Delitschia confertaspora ATCC 74209]|uniref:Uncharacterized protein n=1 Tax=Delitschia confertaspora ATCC 74209 TaxID=1513339 RepID=A0A9P4MTC4_9PLEO|nr:hypothetical protein GQ43DRAFT_16912 [Delitschia confertaspora ATCC 74209]
MVNKGVPPLTNPLFLRRFHPLLFTTTTPHPNYFILPPPRLLIAITSFVLLATTTLPRSLLLTITVYAQRPPHSFTGRLVPFRRVGLLRSSSHSPSLSFRLVPQVPSRFPIEFKFY